MSNKSFCRMNKGKYHKPSKKNSGRFRKNSGYKRDEIEQERRFRTSTPISDVENVTSDFSDSVLDFFYQIWKRGLDLDFDGISQTRISDDNFYPQNEIQRPFYSVSCQFVYVEFVMICQSVFVSSKGVGYPEPVGYRPDGTFGVLPYYWPCVVQ